MKTGVDIPEKVKEKFMVPGLIKAFRIKGVTAYLGGFTGLIVESHFKNKKRLLKTMSKQQFEKAVVKILKGKGFP